MYLASSPLLLTNTWNNKPFMNLILTMRVDDDDKMKRGGSEIPKYKMTQRTLTAGYEL